MYKTTQNTEDNHQHTHYVIRLLTFWDQIWLIWFIVLSATFSYIMAISFSGGRSRKTRREPPTMGKQLATIISQKSDRSCYRWI